MTSWISNLTKRFAGGDVSDLPFSFACDGSNSAKVLRNWIPVAQPSSPKQGQNTQLFRGEVGEGGLFVHAEVTHFTDFPACEWVLSLENTGESNSAIFEDLCVADYTFEGRLPELPETDMNQCERILPAGFFAWRDRFANFILHCTNGAPSNPTDFAAETVALCDNARVVLRAGGGRSSNHDFPFFRIDCGQGAAIVAVGWSGQWRASLDVAGDGGSLRLRTGMEHARFYLKPGERVRLPRVLFFLHEGDRREVHSRFRRLIASHYKPAFHGRETAAHLYCNTCFTRKGAWLNECNEENQVSLIRALAPLQAEAVITDAGWFTGGWPDGAGNWDPDPAKYPGGMGPVARAAQEEGMVYGLWFEPERVIAGTAIHRERPEWVLWRKGDGHTGLLDFGRPEVQDYFFNIVAPFMSLPGFSAYRQDFNMDPLQWWLDNDEPDRTGITEIRYITGLYAYWDRLAGAFPGSFRIDCASGGRRIDLESIKRFHVHQKSDFWFENITDQSSLYGLSRYLPNGMIMTPIDRLDDTTFHSVFASTLCLGWIADDPGFDMRRAVALTGIYRKLRHLLAKDWYPLTPFNRTRKGCLAMQFNSPEDGEGVVLAFRREESQVRELEVRLAGVSDNADYEVEDCASGSVESVRGSMLATGYIVSLLEPGSSKLLHYRKKTRK